MTVARGLQLTCSLLIVSHPPWVNQPRMGSHGDGHLKLEANRWYRRRCCHDAGAEASSYDSSDAGRRCCHDAGAEASSYDSSDGHCANVGATFFESSWQKNRNRDTSEKEMVTSQSGDRLHEARITWDDQHQANRTEED